MKTVDPWGEMQIPKAQKIHPRIDFDWQSIYKQIEEQGVYLEHYTALPCFCGGESPICQRCHGTGFTYQYHRTIEGIFTGISNQSLLWQRYGDLTTGMANLTVHPHNLPGVHDKLIPQEGAVLEKEIAKRDGAEEITSLRYPIKARDLLVGEHLQNVVVKSYGVLYLETKSGHVNEVNVDYVVTDEGKIQWLGTANNPGEGESFVVAYYRPPVYIVVGYPHNTRTAWDIRKKPPEEWRVIELPVQVLLRLEELPWDIE